MAKQGINTGSAPNDGLGDSLLSGAIKINSNFSEIYNTFGNGSNLSSYVSIAGYSTSSGVATYASTSGVATYSNTAGVATVAQNFTGSPNITVSSVNSSGVVTASSFFGSGANLTGIIAGVGIQTSAGLVGTGATILDFRGAGISTITVASGIATINITGGSSSPDISPVMMSMIF